MAQRRTGKSPMYLAKRPTSGVRKREIENTRSQNGLRDFDFSFWFFDFSISLTHGAGGPKKDNAKPTRKRLTASREARAPSLFTDVESIAETSRRPLPSRRTRVFYDSYDSVVTEGKDRHLTRPIERITRRRSQVGWPTSASNTNQRYGKNIATPNSPVRLFDFLIFSIFRFFLLTHGAWMRRMITLSRCGSGGRF